MPFPLLLLQTFVCIWDVPYFTGHPFSPIFRHFEPLELGIWTLNPGSAVWPLELQYPDFSLNLSPLVKRIYCVGQGHRVPKNNPPPLAGGNVEPTVASRIARLRVRKEERAASLLQKAAKSAGQRTLSGFMSCPTQHQASSSSSRSSSTTLSNSNPWPHVREPVWAQEDALEDVEENDDGVCCQLCAHHHEDISECGT